MKTIIKKFIRKIRIILLKIRNGNIFIHKSNLKFKVILDMTKAVDNRFYTKSFEEENFDLLNKILSNGMNVIDVGANIGLYSLLFCKKIGDKGKVFSFEPSPETFFRLKQNVNLNQFKNIKMYNIGLSDRKTKSKFYLCEDEAYSSLGTKPMMPIINEIEIELTTIDEFLKKENIKNVDIIKIDTEGADYLVLKGAEKLLASEKAPILFCEYNRAVEGGFLHKTKDMYDYLVKMGYEIFEIKKGKLLKFDIISSVGSDIICIKSNHKSLFKFIC